MCDTFVATPTGKASMLFGKNSDREPNEAQAIVRIPAMDHDEKELRVTHLSIPQVSHTHEIIISRPFQMWGAEMGGNEHGLVIGNEAIFSKVAIKKPNTELTGMDILRLALERTKDAENAVELIIGLIRDYGQNGWGGYTDKSLYYHNGFLLADRKEAYVLETVGKEWALEKVKGFRSISNAISIGEKFDRSSPGLIENARRNGWVKRGERFHFGKAYSDWFFTSMAKGRIRQQTTTKTGKSCAILGPSQAFGILRGHGVAPDGAFAEYDMSSVCLHAQGLLTPSQTTGSMVAEIPEKDNPIIWLTGTAAPCLSLYKPFFFGTDVLNAENFDQPGAVMDTSLWWSHEKFHRTALQRKVDMASVKKDQKNFENKYLFQVGEISRSSEKIRGDFSRKALAEAENLENGWAKKLKKSARGKQSIFYRWNWSRWNRKAEMSFREP